MVDEFAEEISSSLDTGGRPKRGAAPTIFIGLGEFGLACIRRLRQNFEETPEQLITLAIRAGEDVETGVSFVSDEGLSLILTPGAAAGRAQIYNGLLENQAPVQDWLKRLTTDILAEPAGREQGGRIRVFLFCRAEDIDGSALAAAGPQLIKGALKGFVSNWRVALNAFVLLPKGRSRQGAQVFSLLNELVVGESGYDKVWLVSEANAGGLVGLQGSIDLVSDFAGLLLEPDFDTAVAEVLDVAGADTASFGITSVVHPVGRIVADESARFARELINSGLLSSGGEPFYRLADEYVKTERLNIDSLYNKLMADKDGRISERVALDSLVLTQVPLAFWPDRIASYNAFLGHDRVPGLINKIEKNLLAVSAEVSATLRAKVDELMSEPSALEKTSHFIDRLGEKADELKSLAERAKEEVVGRLPDLAARHDELVRQIQALPGAAAVAARGAALTVLVFFFAFNFIHVLRQIPDRYLDPGYLPPAWPAAVSAAAVTVFIAWLIHRRAENRLYQARERYVNAVAEKYRLSLSFHAFAVLSWWLGAAAGDELGERGLPSFKDIIAGEQGAVTRINRLYLQINNLLQAKQVDFAETRIRRSVFSAFGRRVDWRYKQGRYDLADETQRFTVIGHEGWRQVPLSELNRRLDDFCRHGLDFVDNRSLDRLFLDLGRRRQAMAGVIEDLRKSSQPYIAISTGLPRAAELVGVAGGPQSALATQTTLTGQAAVVPIWSRHSLAFVQLVCPIAVEQLSAYAVWREAYDLSPDKAAIDCLKRGEAA